MIARYFSQISDDELMPPESRAIYLEESKRQGEEPLQAQFRLRQWLNGLREQRAIQLFLQDGGQWIGGRHVKDANE